MSEGYVLIIGHCGQCNKLFSFNPKYVPSISNIPFCKECVEAATPLREHKGLPPIKVHPEAYAPLPEYEL